MILARASGAASSCLVTPCAGLCPSSRLAIPGRSAQGTFLVAYQGGPSQQQGEASILFVRSTDGGVSWSPTVRLTDDEVPLNTQFTPQIDVAVGEVPNVRVDPPSNDRRYDPRTQKEWTWQAPQRGTNATGLWPMPSTGGQPGTLQ